jgi:hypothetical protein
MKLPKTPELKVPDFLNDLYYDLRERRLLPLVALILVAIVAVPFLLSSKSSSSPPPPPPAAVASSSGQEAQLTVVSTDPGLRNPNKRLGHLHEKDPFEQHYTGPVLKPGSAPIEQTSTTTSSTSSTTVTTESEGRSGGAAESPVGEAPAPVPNEPPSSSGGGGGGAAPPAGSNLQIYTFAIDVTVQKKGTGDEKSDSKPTTKEKLVPPATLPNDKLQLLTYIGINTKTKFPLFVVSSEVTGIYGEAKCDSGAGSCQVLEIEPKFPVTIVFGPNAVKYKINVTKIEPVAAGHT